LKRIRRVKRWTSGRGGRKNLTWAETSVKQEALRDLVKYPYREEEGSGKKGRKTRGNPRRERCTDVGGKGMGDRVKGLRYGTAQLPRGLGGSTFA